MSRPARQRARRGPGLESAAELVAGAPCACELAGRGPSPNISPRAPSAADAPKIDRGGVHEPGPAHAPAVALVVHAAAPPLSVPANRRVQQLSGESQRAARWLQDWTKAKEAQAFARGTAWLRARRRIVEQVLAVAHRLSHAVRRRWRAQGSPVGADALNLNTVLDDGRDCARSCLLFFSASRVLTNAFPSNARLLCQGRRTRTPAPALDLRSGSYTGISRPPFPTSQHRLQRLRQRGSGPTCCPWQPRCRIANLCRGTPAQPSSSPGHRR